MDWHFLPRHEGSRGFLPADIAKLAPSWSKHPEVFKARYDQLDEQIKTIEGTKVGTHGSSTETVASLEETIKKLEGDLKLDKTNKEKVVATEKRRQVLMEEKRKLESDFDWAEKKYLFLTVDTVAFLFVLFHTITWFNLTPAAMVVRVKGKRVPDRIVAGSNYVVWVLLSGIVAWIFTRGLK